jgi:hypothetical protein
MAFVAGPVCRGLVKIWDHPFLYFSVGPRVDRQTLFCGRAFLYESTGRFRRAINLSIHRHAATAYGLSLSTKYFGIHCFGSQRTLFLPYSRLTIGAKGHIDARSFTVSSVILCIRVLFCSSCQCKETMCYGKCDGSEETCKTDDQE